MRWGEIDRGRMVRIGQVHGIVEAAGGIPDDNEPIDIEPVDIYEYIADPNGDIEAMFATDDAADNNLADDDGPLWPAEPDSEDAPSVRELLGEAMHVVEEIDARL